MKIFRNIIGVIIGLVIGSLLNGFIINISGSIIPPPEGADVKTIEGLKASLHLFEPKHFIMPFLAHALGTFIGAIIALLIAATNKRAMALTVGGFFLIGGIINVMMLPAPVWFSITDLVLAYLPMAYLATIIFAKRK